MEKIKAENQEENLEVIKDELREKFENVFDNLAPNKFNKDTKNKIKEAEFANIIKQYEKQNRPFDAYKNLLKSLQNSDSDIKKLALFYKDIDYNKEGTVQGNRAKSLLVASDFLKLLDEDQRRDFEKIF